MCYTSQENHMIQMSKDEFKEFFKESKLLLSSLFARRMPRVLIGLDEFWYFTNIFYGEKPDGTIEDEFYMYRPIPDHIVHTVSFKNQESFSKIRKFITDLLVVENSVLALHADRLCQSFSSVDKIKKLRTVTFELDISHDSSIVLLSYEAISEVDGVICKSMEVGNRFSYGHFDLLYNILTKIPIKLNSENIHIQPFPDDFAILKDDVAILHITVPQGTYSVVYIDGYHAPSKYRYINNVKNAISRTIYSWMDFGIMWSTVFKYVDESIEVLSFYIGSMSCLNRRKGE